MGQKVNPHGLRVGVIKDWDSKWYAEADFADCLVEDYNMRKFLKKRLFSAGISKIEIERASDRVKIIIYTAKPGVVIGKGGSEIEKLRRKFRSRQIRSCLSTSRKSSVRTGMRSWLQSPSLSSWKTVFPSAVQ